MRKYNAISIVVLLVILGIHLFFFIGFNQVPVFDLNDRDKENYLSINIKSSSTINEYDNLFSFNNEFGAINSIGIFKLNNPVIFNLTQEKNISISNIVVCEKLNKQIRNDFPILKNLTCSNSLFLNNRVNISMSLNDITSIFNIMEFISGRIKVSSQDINQTVILSKTLFNFYFHNNLTNFNKVLFKWYNSWYFNYSISNDLITLTQFLKEKTRLLEVHSQIYFSEFVYDINNNLEIKVQKNLSQFRVFNFIIFLFNIFIMILLLGLMYRFYTPSRNVFYKELRITVIRGKNLIDFFKYSIFKYSKLETMLFLLYLLSSTVFLQKFNYKFIQLVLHVLLSLVFFSMFIITKSLKIKMLIKKFIAKESSKIEPFLKNKYLVIGIGILNSLMLLIVIGILDIKNFFLIIFYTSLVIIVIFFMYKYSNNSFNNVETNNKLMNSVFNMYHKNRIKLIVIILILLTVQSVIFYSIELNRANNQYIKYDNYSDLMIEDKLDNRSIRYLVNEYENHVIINKTKIQVQHDLDVTFIDVYYVDFSNLSKLLDKNIIKEINPKLFDLLKNPNNIDLLYSNTLDNIIGLFLNKYRDLKYSNLESLIHFPGIVKQDWIIVTSKINYNKVSSKTDHHLFFSNFNNTVYQDQRDKLISNIGSVNIREKRNYRYNKFETMFVNFSEENLESIIIQVISLLLVIVTLPINILLQHYSFTAKYIKFAKIRGLNLEIVIKDIKQSFQKSGQILLTWLFIISIIGASLNLIIKYQIWNYNKIEKNILISFMQLCCGIIFYDCVSIINKYFIFKGD